MALILSGDSGFDLPDGAELAVDEGGTGANNDSDARVNLGLGSVALQNADSVNITGGSVSGITNFSSTGIQDDANSTAIIIDSGGHVLPTSNELQDLGADSSRWRDLYLSGSTINLGEGKITTDGENGVIALIPPVTDSNPNPSAMLINSLGKMRKVDTTGGEIQSSDMDSAANTTEDVFETIDVGRITADSGTFGELIVSGDVNFDSGTLFVDASENRVGIGTSSPEGEFDIRSEFGDWKINEYGHTIFRNNNSNTFWSISGRSNESFSITSGGINDFTDSSFLDASLDNFTILPNGNVGINNNDPNEKLHIVDGSIGFSNAGASSIEKAKINIGEVTTPMEIAFGDVNDLGGAAAISIRTSDEFDNLSDRIIIRGNSGEEIELYGPLKLFEGSLWEGTVSQSGLSSVFESGSNSNGEYIKFADGTLICWGELTEGNTADRSTGDVFDQFGSGFWFSANLTYPTGFSSVPAVMAWYSDDALGKGEAIVSVSALSRTTTGFTWVGADVSTGSGIQSLGFTAFGRWY